MQDLSSSSGIESLPPAVEIESPNHWTVREFPFTSNSLLTLHICNSNFQKPQDIGSESFSSICFIFHIMVLARKFSLTRTKFFFFLIIELEKSEVKVAQSCPTLCRPMDYIVYGILQARIILEWAAFPFSRNLPNSGVQPRSPAFQSDSLPAEPQGA